MGSVKRRSPGVAWQSDIRGRDNRTRNESYRHHPPGSQPDLYVGSRNAREIVRALAGRWLGTYGTARCPAHDDHDPSLSVTNGGDGRTLVYCHAGCEQVAVIDALRHLGLWPESGGRELRFPHRPEPKEVSEVVRHNSISDFGERLWRECQLIAPDCPAGQYLASRGCALPHCEGDLRWHPTLLHPSGYYGSALVGLITDIRDNTPLSLHQTWIQTNGRKAEISTPRLLLKGHRKKGGCIRLWPDDRVTYGLGIAEGIETALTLARGFTPVWSVIDSGNMANFPVLGGIEALTVAVDHDSAGIRASEKAARAWYAAGREVRIVKSPNPGDDLNDWARALDR